MAGDPNPTQEVTGNTLQLQIEELHQFSSFTMEDSADLDWQIGTRFCKFYKSSHCLLKCAYNKANSFEKQPNKVLKNHSSFLFLLGF